MIWFMIVEMDAVWPLWKTSALSAVFLTSNLLLQIL